jgi:hypothetical protein
LLQPPGARRAMATATVPRQTMCPLREGECPHEPHQRRDTAPPNKFGGATRFGRSSFDASGWPAPSSCARTSLRLSVAPGFWWCGTMDRMDDMDRMDEEQWSAVLRQHPQTSLVWHLRCHWCHTVSSNSLLPSRAMRFTRAPARRRARRTKPFLRKNPRKGTFVLCFLGGSATRLLAQPVARLRGRGTPLP